MTVKTLKRVFFLVLALIVAMPALLIGSMLWQEAKKEQDRKALITAIQAGNTEAALSALQHGSDPNSCELPADRTGIGQRFLDYLTGHHKPTNGDSALELAVGMQNHAVTLELVRRGARDIHNEVGVRIIYVVLQNRWEDVAQEMLKRGVPAIDTDLLMAAAQFDDGQIVRQLVEGGVPIGSFTSGSQALTTAMLYRHTDIAAYLIAHGTPAHNPDAFGQTALMAAAQRGDDASVRLLLQHGAMVNYAGASGTALTAAAVKGHLSTMKVLVAAGADIHAGGLYPKMLARVNQRGYTEVAAYLQRGDFRRSSASGF